jgi:hypothetical protein
VRGDQAFSPISAGIETRPLLSEMR